MMIVVSQIATPPPKRGRHVMALVSAGTVEKAQSGGERIAPGKQRTALVRKAAANRALAAAASACLRSSSSSHRFPAKS